MIIGDRIYLRPFEHKDVPIRTKWMNDPDVRKYLNSPYPVSEDSTENWLKNLANDKTRLDLIVCLKDGDMPIGYRGLRDIDYVNLKVEAYVGIGEKKYWGKGYSKESMIISYRYYFNHYGFNKIYSKIRSDHKRMIETCLSYGLKVDGILRQDIFSHGEYRDMVLMSILRDEFFEKHGN